ncbi:MAG: FAD-dependent monooxygenase [Hyphomicrobiaceae bacterium]|nr:FAD-dependent monooxygenase [Hyphomicrobiaceae bacterium]
MPAVPGHFDVVVSGASFTGLAVACALAKGLDGELSIAVLDAGPEAGRDTGDTPRAFAVSAASRHLLSGLGIWDRLAAQAEPVRQIEITDSPLEAGMRPVLMTYDNALEDGEAASYIVPDGTLASALRAALATSANVSVLHRVEARTLVATSPTAVQVGLSDGSTLSARLLIAAEGRRSRIREAAGIKVIMSDYRQTGICTRISHELGHDSRAIQHFLPAGPFAMLPLPGHRSCITWTEQTSEAHRIMKLPDDAFLVEVERRCGGRLGAVTLDGPRASWPLSLHMARELTAPRIALIGDTIRGVHPIAGQGLNLGFRDVAALAESVADNVRLGLDPGASDILERYARWRRFDGTMSALTFDGLNRLFSNDWTLLRSVREAALGLMDRLPMAKSLLVKEAAGLTGDVPRLLRGQPL